MGSFQSVIFNLDSEVYGIDINHVNAIENIQQIVRVPNASPNIKGIINLRGEVIPVINLRAKFHTENQTAPPQISLIIVNQGSTKFALEVDGVQEIHSLEDDQISEIPIIVRGDGVDYFEKVAKINNRLVVVINPDKLLSGEEEKIVEELIDAAADEKRI